MDSGLIILPIGEEPDAQPIDTAEAVRSLLAQIDRTGETISRAAADAVQQISPQRLAVLADQLDQLAQRAREISEAEPERTELDSIEAEAAALLELMKKEAEALPKIDEARALPAKLDDLPFPLDKATRALFQNPAGRGKIDTATKAQRAQGVHHFTALSLEFVEEAVKKKINQLSPYDRHVLLTVGGLMSNGIDTVMPAQLFRKMGGKTNPNNAQRAQIFQSVKTLCCAWVTANNEAERRVNPDAPKINMEFALLEARICTVEYRGKRVDAIKILAMPQWLQLADLRGQITRVPFEAYADGLSLTTQNLDLSNYLLDRIARINANPEHAEPHIRIDTAADKIGAKIMHHEARKKFAAKMETKLKHYANIGHITGYRQYEHGFLIIPKKETRKN